MKFHDGIANVMACDGFRSADKTPNKMFEIVKLV